MRCKESTIIPSRLVKARKSLGMTQAQFAANIRERLPEDETISPILVSAWETGRRSCKKEIVEIIADLSGYALDYFTGKCDEKGNLTQSIAEEFVGLRTISNDCLYRYDQKPVYVEFIEHQHPSGWALVNYTDKELVFTKFLLKINQRNLCSLRIYATKPYYDIVQEELTTKRLDLGTLFDLPRVYVVMNSSDPVIRAKYNGWYSHNSDKSALQNHIGLVLSYDGLGIAYNAYPDIVYKEFSSI